MVQIALFPLVLLSVLAFLIAMVLLWRRGKCIEYGAAVDADTGLKLQTAWGADSFLVIEKWESVEALKAHAAAPHMAAYGAKTKELIASRVIHILSPA